MPNDIVTMNARALSAAIHGRQVSCVEVMQAYLDHIALQNPSVNAIVSLRDRAPLMSEARAMDAELQSRGPRGWMHGFPAAVKDLDAVQGLPWTQGSPIFKDTIAAADSIQVARMRASGAIFIGKTNTPEFGLGSHTFNAVFGTTRNAYDPALTAGGSSGGAAVALATRMLPVADGTDHAGSLRNPSAFNNVFGLRTSFGRIPEGAGDVFSTSLAVPGPMARNVEDLAMLLSVQAGPDPRAPLSLLQSPTVFADFAGAPVQDLKGKRIAWLGDLDGYLPVEQGILSLCEDALRVFESLGCTVEPVSPKFPLASIWDNWLVLRAWTNNRKLGALYRDVDKRRLMKPEAVWEVTSGQAISPDRLLDALAVRSAWYNVVRELHQRYDVLALPSAQVFPFAAELRWPEEVAGRHMDTYHRWMEVVIPGTMSGCPVMGMPVGFGESGSPMGMQLIGPMHGELTCMTIARAYDHETRWTERRRPS